MPRPPTPKPPVTPADRAVRPDLLIHYSGLRDYQEAWEAMRRYTDERDDTSPDQLWLLEHPSLYTLGRNGRPEHILRHTGTPIIQSDRGGQVTWHGPGQLMAYVLLDINRLELGIRTLVHRLEAAVIGLLAQYGLTASARVDAPGVYIDGSKIASIGLRVRRGCSYHGISLNINPTLEPFAHINPCGMPGLPVTSLLQEGIAVTTAECAPALALAISNTFDYSLPRAVRA
jgi:lipoyl(octanoyl) transferase